MSLAQNQPTTDVVPRPWLLGAWPARIFALLLAGIVIMLIDRELSDVLFSGSVPIVAARTAEGEALVVSLPPGFMLAPAEAAVAPAAEFRVLGHRRDRARVHAPFRAVIPAERLAFISTDRIEWVSLEPGDLELGDVSGAEVVFVQPVRIPVAREVEQDFELEGVPATPVPQGLELSVEFTPGHVRLRGPQPLLRTLGKLVIPLTLPRGEAAEARAIATLPPDLERRGVRLLSDTPGQAIVRLIARQEERLVVQNVRIRVLRSLMPVFSFALEPPFDLEHMNVTLSGSRASIARLRADPQALQKLRQDLMVLVPAERMAERERTPIAAGESRRLEVLASLPLEALQPLGLVPATRLVVPVTVTRPPRAP
jgi:hypothetical protein